LPGCPHPYAHNGPRTQAECRQGRPDPQLSTWLPWHVGQPVLQSKPLRMRASNSCRLPWLLRPRPSSVANPALTGHRPTPICIAAAPTAFHAGELTFDGTVGYFVQFRYTNAIFTRDQYRPGNELDAAIGINYNFSQVGPFTNIAPTLSLINSDRTHDTGAGTIGSGLRRQIARCGPSYRS